jgi:hypothetical protein
MPQRQLRPLELAGATADWALLEQSYVAIHANDLEADAVVVACHPFTQASNAKAMNATELFITRWPPCLGLSRSPRLNLLQRHGFRFDIGYGFVPRKSPSLHLILPPMPS